MTKILILVSSCFLILNAPAHISIVATKLYSNSNTPVILTPTELVLSANETVIVRINETSNRPMTPADLLLLARLQGITDDVGIHLMYTIVLLTQYISYASYSINFFLYSFSGMTFRTNLKQWTRKIVNY